MKKYGFTNINTLYGDCTCQDEINHDNGEEDLPDLLQKRWGEKFNLAGLGGLMFTGKTGWKAFGGQCPDDGNIFILFAPHVGIDKNGNVGKI